MEPDKTEPLVSVVVPMRNAESYIDATLRSILQEARVAIEVIVVDDQSSDTSRTLVSKLKDSRVRLVDGPGRGISACVNVGLEHTQGTIIMRCDADDIYPPNRIFEQTIWLQRNPNYDAVCGGFSTIDQTGKLVVELQCGTAPSDISNELVGGKTRTHFCTYAIRSSLVRKVGEFREYFELGEDLDYQFRLGEIGRIGYEPNNWYIYRIHPQSILHTSDRRMFFEQAAKAMLRQRRVDGSDDLERGRTPTLPSVSSATFNASAHIQGMLFGEAWRKHRNGKKTEAIKLGMRAITKTPLRYDTLKAFSRYC